MPIDRFILMAFGSWSEDHDCIRKRGVYFAPSEFQPMSYKPYLPLHAVPMPPFEVNCYV